MRVSTGAEEAGIQEVPSSRYRSALEVTTCDFKDGMTDANQPYNRIQTALDLREGGRLRKPRGRSTMRAVAPAHGRGSTTHTITLIPGDGTGPQIVEATRRAGEATGGRS